MQIQSIVQSTHPITRVKKEYPKHHNCLCRVDKKDGSITCVNEDKKGIKITQSDCDNCLCAEIPTRFNRFLFGKKGVQL